MVFTVNVADGAAGAVVLDRLGLRSAACAAVAREPTSAATATHASSTTIAETILRTDFVNESLTVFISLNSFWVKCDDSKLAVRASHWAIGQTTRARSRSCPGLA